VAIIMVKKVLADGSPCRKCAQAESMLKRRGLWEKIDRVLLADEADKNSEGMALARELNIDIAPFFVVDQGDGRRVYSSPIELIREVLKPKRAKPSGPDLEALQTELRGRAPQAIVKSALTHFGADCAIAFSGAEDVALIELAAQTGLAFSVFCLDTGRLHPQTLEFIEKVSRHYAVAIEVMVPEADALQELVRGKGLFSFYQDGHKECCGIRKVEPLGRILKTKRAWMSGQRQDQSLTRVSLEVVEADGAFEGQGGPLVKFNPLAQWSSQDVWAYLESENVPTNPLHLEGYRSIGCAPCTRPTTQDQHEREGRWWWEGAGEKECGLHLAQDAKIKG
jgi:thioredoxin-dependent adenylylsulfate APS reductase